MGAADAGVGTQEILEPYYHWQITTILINFTNNFPPNPASGPISMPATPALSS